MLADRYAAAIHGVISCFDRVRIQGTLPDIGHPAAMTRVLSRRRICTFDLTEFARPLREAIADNADRVAAGGGEGLGWFGGPRGHTRVRLVAPDRLRGRRALRRYRIEAVRPLRLPGAESDPTALSPEVTVEPGMRIDRE